MEEYCRFCAKQKNNLSSVFDLGKGICDWIIEIINRGLNLSNDQNSSRDLSDRYNICYVCLCTIEDFNYFIENCRKSVLRFEEIWRNNIETTSKYIQDGISSENEHEIDSLKEENYELEYLKDISDDEPNLEIKSELFVDIIDTIEVNNDYQDHIKLDLQKTFQCKSCSETFESSNELTSHNETHKKFLCTQCGANFKDRPIFNYHMKKHMNKNSLTCDYCNKSFITKYQLLSHRWTHTGTGFENHECEKCGKKCRTAHELEIHMRFHTQLRQYKCEICSKRFIIKNHLKQHMVTHTGERNYLCNAPGCNKSYTTVSSLKKHKDIHITDNKKKFPCNYCSKKFSMYFIVRDHIRKSHKKLLAASLKPD